MTRQNFSISSINGTPAVACVPLQATWVTAAPRAVVSRRHTSPNVSPSDREIEN